MFCQKCGREISDQAKFCNHCGNPVNNAQPQQTAQPQAAPVKKKGKAGKTILAVILVAAVFFGSKMITQSFLSSTQNRDSGSQNKGSSFEQGFQEGLTEDPDIKSAMDSCFYGALYQDGSLRYGMTKLYAPGYSLVAGEGDERDWLVSSDGACVLAAYKQLEIIDVSQAATTADGLLSSYKSSYSDASMIDFRKYDLNGFPVVQYIVGYTTDGVYQYQGELIVFPSEPADETIRLDMLVDVASGYGADDINAVFDTLEVSPDLKLNAEDTQVMGMNRITVK